MNEQQYVMPITSKGQVTIPPRSDNFWASRKAAKSRSRSRGRRDG